MLLAAQFGDFIILGSTCTVQVKESRLKTFAMLRSDAPHRTRFLLGIMADSALWRVRASGRHMIAAGFQVEIEIEHLKVRSNATISQHCAISQSVDVQRDKSR